MDGGFQGEPFRPDRHPPVFATLPNVSNLRTQQLILDVLQLFP